MPRISQRELRNDNAEIMRGMEQSESCTVTRRGVPVARVVPISESDLRLVRPVRQRAPFGEIERVDSNTATEHVLADLRGER